jgi:hypothetical protein
MSSSGDNDHNDCVVPPVPQRSNRLPGGQSKPRAPLMFLTFGRCSALGAAFAHSARVAGGDGVCVFRFGGDRIDLVAVRRTRTMMSVVSVPRAAFVAYRHESGDVVQFAVANDALDRIARVCLSPLYNNYSLTFMFECNGMPEEVLHVMLCSRSAAASPPPLIVRATLAPARDQSDADAAASLVEAATAAVGLHYQFRVRLSAASLCDNVKCMLAALEPSTVTILLGPEALEIAALTRDARTQLCVSWPFGDGAVAGKRKRVANSGGMAHLETLIHGVRLAQFRDSQRFAASTLADALAQLDGGDAVVLYLGVGVEHGEAMPLLVERTCGACQYRVWVAPRPPAD